MKERSENTVIPMLVTDQQGTSVWTERAWPTEPRVGMVLTDRVGCSSLRLRQSKPGYHADWHVAGDPTLIIVQQGALRIGLRDGSTRDFVAGQAFIAADAIPDGAAFDPDHHGHNAEVVGESPLSAVHIKLNDFQR